MTFISDSKSEMGEIRKFKLVLLGEAAVGKSSLMVRYTDNEFDDRFLTTVGVDFRTHKIEIGKEVIKLQIWDTAGQERFRSISSSYYRGADCILFVYDITHRESYEKVKKWVQDVDNYRDDSKYLRCLVGSKCDLSSHREVPTEEACEFATDQNIIFFETSSKQDKNVTEMFTSLAKALLKLPIDNKIQCKEIVSPPKEKSCCG